MRKRLDYLKIISFNGLSDEFELYCFKHRDLSLRRNAYNFVRSNDCVRTGRNSLIEAYKKASEIDTSSILDVVYGEARI